MSDLQCAATLLIAGAGEEDEAKRLGGIVRDRHLAMVYSSASPDAVRAAELVAGALGVQARPVDRLGGEQLGGSVDEVTGALAEIADLHRGETVLVVGHDDDLRRAVAHLTGNVPHPRRELGAGDVVEVAADADGWVRQT